MSQGRARVTRPIEIKTHFSFSRYISLLDTIAQEWFAPLKEILSSSFLLTLFGNFSTIRQFHHTFLPALEKDFSAAFIENSEFLKMYCTYLNTFPEAVTLYSCLPPFFFFFNDRGDARCGNNKNM